MRVPRRLRRRRVSRSAHTNPRSRPEYDERKGRERRTKEEGRYAQTSGKITEDPISTFGMGTIPNAKLSLLITIGSFAIPLPPDIPSLPLSLSLSRSKPRFTHASARTTRGNTAKGEVQQQQRTPLPTLPLPFFPTTERFGVNRNRISRERRLGAIREVFTPSCEGTSMGGGEGGSTIEGRKEHGSRNLSSVAQHCCHGRFALSAERIDGGERNAVGYDHYFSMRV